MGDFEKDQQLRAACTVHPYEASRLLNVRHFGRLNGVPDAEWFRRQFDFSQDDLRKYISGNHGLAQEILDRAISSRAFPEMYLEPENSGYKVGRFDGKRRDERRHQSLEDAATDYVLGFWGLPRLRGVRG